MRFGVLGPVQVDDGAGGMRPVAGARQRTLLAALLVRANRVVPADELAELVWDGTPPAGAAALRTQVMRLRRALSPDAAARIVASDPGYVITISAEELDRTLFEALHQESGAAMRAGRWREAVSVLDQALALWRGAVLLDVESQALRDECGEHLEQLRVQALEWRADAGMRLGRHEQLLPELRDLIRQDPLREHNHAQLMLALYRCGRRAEALQAYQSARNMLREELSVEPGTALQSMHQRMLAADPALTAPELARPESGGPGPTLPRQLPSAVAHFTGRTGELAALNELVDREDGQRPGVAVISAIAGTAGVGKTALAVQWAHQVAERFPDGQLYVNLRGYDPDQPMAAADALAGFLRSLGVPGRDIPASTDERAALYRSSLATQRIVVIADNAASAEQVRPLLPGTRSCVLVVTSRDSLAGLVARDGARRLDLDVLPLGDAVGLLRELIGERADADPGATAALAEHCCRLPLALRVAAELAVGRPAASIADLAGELANHQHRLELLQAAGDPRTAVRAVFSWSYRHLDAAAARTFRLVCLHPGADLDAYGAAALTGSTPQQAGQMLGLLAQAHLIHPSARADRYGMHDLLRAYGTGLTDGDDERRSALSRLLDYYLQTASAAMDILFPGERHRRPQVPPPATAGPPVNDDALARAWLDTERQALVAVAAYAASRAWPGYAARLAAVVFRYLDTRGHYPEAFAIHTLAHRDARDTGDRAAEATALTSLGTVSGRLGRYEEAASYHQQALTLYRQTEDQSGQARALNNLGNIDLQRGRCQQAGWHHQQALALYRQTGDQTGQARALNNLALLDLRQGRYEQAADHLEQALTLFRQAGDRMGEAHVLGNLGETCLRQGRHEQAGRYLKQALMLSRESADRPSEASILCILGDLALQQGRNQQAADHHQHALVLYRQTSYRPGEAKALNGLGEALLAAGQPVLARTQHTTALSLADQAGDQHQQARAHSGLARSCHATGDTSRANQHQRQALTLYTSLGEPEADQMRAESGG